MAPKKGKRYKFARHSLKARVQSWHYSKVPLFYFGVKFVVVTALLFLLSLSSVYQRILTASVAADACLASSILNKMGEGTSRFWQRRVVDKICPFCYSRLFRFRVYLVLLRDAFSLPCSLESQNPGHHPRNCSVAFAESPSNHEPLPRRRPFSPLLLDRPRGAMGAGARHR